MITSFFVSRMPEQGETGRPGSLLDACVRDVCSPCRFFATGLVGGPFILFRRQTGRAP